MSLYDDLGVPQDADSDEIIRAHRRAARRTHPDAGGDRDEFEKIQRAYLVLRDPAKRERYDATGEAHEQPHNPLAEFAEVIIPAFDAALNEAADRLERIDVMAMTKAKLRNAVVNARTEIANGKQVEARIEKALKRLKFTGDGVDLIRSVLTDRIGKVKAQIAGIEQNITTIEGAVAMIDQYGWDVMRPEPSPYANASQDQLLRMMMGASNYQSRPFP